MKLYHDGDRAPHAGRFGPVDEEDCYTDLGLRRGIWLTSRPLSGPCSTSMDIEAIRLTDFEVTVDGDRDRTFVVPHLAIQDVQPQPTGVTR